MTATISIICPMYNAEKYVAQMAESVLSQTYLNWELIVIDDSSTDRSADICKEYMEKDTRIKMLTQNRGGVSAARNLGLEHAKGEYIAFIDADDEYTPIFLEKMLEKMTGEIDLVYANYVNMNEGVLSASREKISVGTLDKEGFIWYVLKDSVFTTMWRGLFRASLCKQCTFSSLKFCEDLFFILEYAQKAEKFCLVDEAYYHYRRDNASSMTNNDKNKKYLEDYAMIPVNLCEYFQRNHYNTLKYAEVAFGNYRYAEERIIRIASLKEYYTIIHDRKYMTGKQWYKNIYNQNHVSLQSVPIYERTAFTKYIVKKSYALIRYIYLMIKKGCN